MAQPELLVKTRGSLLVMAHKEAKKMVREELADDYPEALKESLKVVFGKERHRIQSADESIGSVIDALKKEVIERPTTFAPVERRFVAQIVRRMTQYGPKARFSLRQVDALVRMHRSLKA